MPEMKSKPVKTTINGKATVVAMASYPVWTSHDEILKDLGPAKVLELAQSQNTTNIMNDLRGQFTGKPAGSKLREQAQLELARGIDLSQPSNPDTIAKLAIMQDPTKFAEYLDKRVEELKASFEKERAKRIAEAAEKFKDVVTEEEEETVSA